MAFKFLDRLLGRVNGTEEEEIDTDEIEASLEESQSEFDLALSTGAIARQTKRRVFQDATKVIKEAANQLTIPPPKPVPTE